MNFKNKFKTLLRLTAGLLLLNLLCLPGYAGEIEEQYNPDPIITGSAIEGMISLDNYSNSADAFKYLANEVSSPVANNYVPTPLDCFGYYSYVPEPGLNIITGQSTFRENDLALQGMLDTNWTPQPWLQTNWSLNPLAQAVTTDVWVGNQIVPVNFTPLYATSSPREPRPGGFYCPATAEILIDTHVVSNGVNMAREVMVSDAWYSPFFREVFSGMSDQERFNSAMYDTLAHEVDHALLLPRIGAWENEGFRPEAIPTSVPIPENQYYRALEEVGASLAAISTSITPASCAFTQINYSLADINADFPYPQSLYAGRVVRDLLFDRLGFVDFAANREVEIATGLAGSGLSQEDEARIRNGVSLEFPSGDFMNSYIARHAVDFLRAVPADVLRRAASQAYTSIFGHAPLTMNSGVVPEAATRMFNLDPYESVYRASVSAGPNRSMPDFNLGYAPRQENLFIPVSRDFLEEANNPARVTEITLLPGLNDAAGGGSGGAE